MVKFKLQPLYACLLACMFVAACSGQAPNEEDESTLMSYEDYFAAERAINEPDVEKKPVEITQHGETRIDNYAWLRVENWQDVLRDPGQLSDDVRSVLDTENAYYEAVTQDLEPLRKTLFEEMRARLKEDESSVPLPDGPWLYWRSFRTGGQYPIFKRKPLKAGDTQGTFDDDLEEILFDGDQESKGAEFFSIGFVAHSPDHNFIAYGVDRVGSEYYTIKVRDLKTGDDLAEAVESADRDGIAWDAQSKGFYYIERDDNQRPKWVKYHALGADPASDPVIYEEPGDDFFLSVSKSQSGAYIFITANSNTTSEVRFVRADAAIGDGSAPQLIEPRNNGVEYYVDHHDEAFYILTNADEAVNFKIVTAPVDAPARANWRDFIAHRADAYIANYTTYKDYIVWLERRDALPHLVIADYQGERHEVAVDEAAYSLGMVGGYEYDTKVLRYSYESPATPEETFDYDMASRTRSLVKRQEVPSGHDKNRYIVERFKAKAPDGAGVPVTVLRLKDTPLDGSAPTLLYGYGSYGATIPASFSTSILSLVDRGVISVIAHPRGGASLGRQWYLDGKLEKKMNTFTDFNAVADDLIARGYTAEKKIVIYGGSAGGLLVGAAVNLRPELYAGVLAAVPFVDVLNTISDGELPLTPPEWEEWGNPITSEQEYGWIRAYSPYENIAAASYPPVMATGGLTDYRVTYWEMSKWVARLRDDTNGGGPFVLRMNMGAGHAGSAARFESLDERAHLYAFALKAMGVVKKEQ